MGILAKSAWLPACLPVTSPAADPPSAPSAPDPYRHPSRLSPETNLPFQTEDPDEDRTKRIGKELAGLKRSMARWERKHNRFFDADEIDFDRECEMDRLLSRGCAKLNGGEKELLALNLRAAAIRTALACRHATGEGLFVFDNGTVALKDGTCGVVLARHGGFVFLVSDGRGHRVPHTVFAGAKTQSALFGGRALGRSRVVRLRFEGKDFDVGLDGSGNVFAVFDGEGKRQFRPRRPSASASATVPPFFLSAISISTTRGPRTVRCTSSRRASAGTSSSPTAQGARAP